MDTEYVNYNLEISIDNCKFSDFFNVEEMQKIQDNVAEALDIASIITTPTGKPITKPSNFCEFCEKIVRNSESGIKNCMNSDATLGKPNDGPIIQQCLSAGLLDAGVSFVIGNKHIANWLIGQVRDESINMTEEEKRKKALELNIDPDEYCRAIDKVIFVPRKKFESIANHIYLIVRQLCEIAYKNYVQREEIAYRRKLEEDLKSEHQKLINMSKYDGLTGVYSRNYFNSILSDMEEKNISPVGVVMGDVNNLKLANDVFGHNMGDKLLQTVSGIMKDCAKEGYIIGRCGGDEFNVLMPNATDDEVREYCESVLRKCAEHTELDVKPSISLGYGRKVAMAQSINGAISFAEEKMYRHKGLIKQSQDILGDVENTIYKKGYFNKGVVEKNIRIANEFGKFLGMDDDDIERLAIFTRISDFGIVSLTRREYEELDSVENACQHIDKSYCLAKLTGKTQGVADSIYQSHEWWNGQGLPLHKKGEEIDKTARIGAIICYYTQSMAEPMYGYNMTEKQAKNQIKRYSGTRFDPTYAEKFVEYLESME